MGLIKAISGAIRSELADQWKEFIYCDRLPENILMAKGKRRTADTTFGSSNTKGSANIISAGSIITVNEGQAMLVVEQGEVVDITCEPGAYTFNTSTEPSVFSGAFGEALKKSFKNIGRRFAYGGATDKDQRVYYINMKEILGNKYGSAQPMPYDDPYYKTVLYIRYYGTFSYRITDPMAFYRYIAGNAAERYTSEMLMEQCSSEFITAFDSALNRFAEQGVKFSLIPSKGMELADIMNDVLDAEWKRERGIEITAVGIEKITPDEKSRQRIESFDNAVMLGSNQDAMQGRMVSAQAAMFENMGKQSGGVNGSDMMDAVMGMMGMNMMNNMMGNMSVNQQVVQTAQPVVQQPAQWSCDCGAVNAGKFCSECGKKRPRYKCDKCGWEPKDPSKPPKFCPECGDRFDDDDQE